MASYNTILVPMADAASGLRPLEAGARLAKAFDGHLIGLHVRPEPEALIPNFGGAVVYETISASIMKQFEARAAAAKVLFDNFCQDAALPMAAVPPPSGPSAEWIDVTGEEEILVPLKSRLADLLVVARFTGSADEHAPTVYAALEERGRPVLVVPPDPLKSLGERVIIGWNGSGEASRAVAAAIPLLQRASVVTIVSIGDIRAGAPRIAPEDLASYLTWQRIKAQCMRVPGLEARPAMYVPTLLAETCQELGADILVAGAFTHARWREGMFGGVTRHMLYETEIPCLLCH